MERRLAAVMASDMVGYSRLMELDDLGTLQRQKKHRSELIDPMIERNRGRIVKTTGDGLLVEFASAQDAVRCALDIQIEIPDREQDQSEDLRIKYRIGINLGDVIFDDSDMFGDGVNVAARLEGLSEPGGVCISDIVHQTVQDRIAEPFRDLGGQRVKNISRPIRVWQWTHDVQPDHPKSDHALQQHVKFCTSADGTSIAYAGIGDGPVVVRAPHWLNHIEYEWQSLLFGPFLNNWANATRLVRFDQRGNGLSDWDVDTLTVDSMIEDMEAVVQAAGLKKFALLGISQGSAFSVRYALKHPEQVSCLVLYGGYMRGRLKREDPEEQKMFETAALMIREGWGSQTPLYRNFFTSAFLPDGPAPVQNSFDEVQRISTNAHNAWRIYEMNANMETVEQAKKLKIPTLVLHHTGDRVAPLAEGRLTAKLIPGAEFLEIAGNNHVAVQGNPGFDRFFDAALPFIRKHSGA
jgi:class 3 adenylate cyclase/pimeloyl-ACP methyl ester carboxylesterase